MGGLFFYEVYSQRANNGAVSYVYVTWPIWLLVFACMAVPFIYNFRAYDYQKVQEDIREWRAFVEEIDDMGVQSWNYWYTKNCQDKFEGPSVSWGVRLSLVLRGSFLLVVPLIVLYQYWPTLFPWTDPCHRGGWKANIFFILLLVALVVAALQFVPCAAVIRRNICGNPTDDRRWQLRLFHCCHIPLLCCSEGSFVGLGIAVGLVVLSATTGTSFGFNPHMMPSWTAIIIYFGAWLTNTAFYSGRHNQKVVRRMYSSFDNILGTAMLFVLWMCSLFSALLAPLQMHLLFNEGIQQTLEMRRREGDILEEPEPEPEPESRVDVSRPASPSLPRLVMEPEPEPQAGR